MVTRWHLDLAGWAVLLGVVLVGVDRWGPSVLRRRTVAVAGLLGAVLGGFGNPRAVPWLVTAAALSVTADRERPAHPLGSATVALTVVSLIGVWSAVPDTEPPLAVGCVLLGVAVGRLVARRPVGPPAAIALVAAVAGSAWVGSAGWVAALASAAAVGMVLCAPLVLGFVDLRARSMGLLAAVHVAGALTVPRVLMRLDPVPAVAGAGALLAVDAMVVWTQRGGRAVDRSSGDTRRSAPDRVDRPGRR